tara:strand:+ start:527 stop:859 length:333 start_codon:yes stop_codon:yes gene_type:complete
MIETTILIISILFNIFFVFYTRWLLKNLNFLSENIVNVLETIETFSTHLTAIHELEIFYGDDTLQNLIKHSKQVVDEIKLYKDVYTLTNDELELEDLFNDETKEDEEEED